MEKSVASLMKEYGCDFELAKRIFAIREAGYRHGARGWYPNGDFSSDADWVYGVGSEIQKVEEALGIDDDSVFDEYLEAHSDGLKVYDR